MRPISPLDAGPLALSPVDCSCFVLMASHSEFPKPTITVSPKKAMPSSRPLFAFASLTWHCSQCKIFVEKTKICRLVTQRHRDTKKTRVNDHERAFSLCLCASVSLCFLCLPSKHIFQGELYLAHVGARRTDLAEGR